MVLRGCLILLIAVVGVVASRIGCGDGAAIRGAAEQYVVRWWTDSDGLPEPPLTGIAIAADGAIICSSRTQVARFDGEAFAPYPAELIEPLSDSIGSFSGIAYDRQQRLWIRGARGVAWFTADAAAPSGWRTGSHLVEQASVYSMACGADGEMVFIGPGMLRTVDGNSLIEMPVDRSSSSPPSWKYGDVDPVTGDLWLWGHFKDSRTLHWTRLGAQGPPAPPARVDDALVAGAVVSMAMTATGPVALLPDGLAALRDGSWERIAGPLPGAERSESGKLAVAADGAVWISRHQSLTVFRDGRFETIVAGLPGFSFFTRGLIGDSAGGVWAACDGGLVAIRPARVRFEEVPGCQAVHVRPGGDVLAGVPGAVVMVPSPGRRVGAEPPASAQRVVGTLPSGAMPTAIVEDEAGRIWVGTEDHYLFRIDGDEVTRVTRADFRFKELRSITAIVEDNDGQIWVGTGNGLARQERASEEFALLGSRGEELRELVIGLAPDPRGGVLCATPARGIERVDADGVRTPVLPVAGLPGRRRLTILRDPDGVVWVGGDQGLVRVAADGSVARITSINGLVDDAIRQITDDARGRLWMATKGGRIQGIRRADLEAVAAGRVAVVRGIILGPLDGIGTRECVGSLSNSRQASGGGTPLIIACADGFVRFDPAILAVPRPTPLPQVSWGGASSGDFTFSVPGLHWGEPLLLQSRLHGVDPQWSQPSRARHREYDSLPPGDHVLEVRTLAGETERDFATAALAIETPRAWWQSSGVLAAGAAAAVGASAAGAWGVARHRARRTIVRLEREQAMDRERTRIARDIHDVLGAGLTRVALASDLARHSEDELDDVSERFDSIYRDARGLARSLDEIVWAVNPQNDTLGDFLSYTINDVEESLEAGGLTLRLDLPHQLPSDRPLDAHIRHHLCLVVRETVTNVLRHAGATHVNVAIRVDDETITIRIEDDGIGLTAEPAPECVGNGLANIRHRVEALQGHVTFGAAVDHGTVVTVSVPLKATLVGETRRKVIR